MPGKSVVHLLRYPSIACHALGGVAERVEHQATIRDAFPAASGRTTLTTARTPGVRSPEALRRAIRMQSEQSERRLLLWPTAQRLRIGDREATRSVPTRDALAPCVSR